MTTEPTFTWTTVAIGVKTAWARAQVIAVDTAGTQVRLKFDDTSIATAWVNVSNCRPSPAPIFTWLDSGAGS